MITEISEKTLTDANVSAGFTGFFTDSDCPAVTGCNVDGVDDSGTTGAKLEG